MKNITYLLIILTILFITNLGVAQTDANYRKERAKTITKILNLSTKQQAEIKAIKKQYKPVIDALYSKYQQSEKEFVKMYKSTKKDSAFDNALLNQKLKISQAQAKYEQKKLEQGLKIRNVFSKDQLISFNKFVSTYPSKE